MKIYFLGVRGSVPITGNAEQQYGGSSVSIYVELFEDCGFVFDMGTGIRNLKPLVSSELFVLLSHQHWDHIQGFPHWQAIYNGDKNINIYSDGYKGLWPILSQMDGICWPVHYRDLPSHISTYPLASFHEHFLNTYKGLDFSIEFIKLNHPGGATGCKFSYKGQKVAFIFDHEIESSQLSDKKQYWKNLLNDCNIVVHDLQYLRERDAHCVGWGHSFVDDMCEFFKDITCDQLILFGHHPNATDVEIDRNAANLQDKITSACQVSVARENACWFFENDQWSET